MAFEYRLKGSKMSKNYHLKYTPNPKELVLDADNSKMQKIAIFSDLAVVLGAGQKRGSF